MPAPETEIIITKDGGEVWRRTVGPGVYVIGREPECDVPINVELVSRRHAQLTVNLDSVQIEDLGSSNGTFVNGQAVTESTRLWPNQKIQIGAATMELRRVRASMAPDVSLAPSTAAVQRLLPEELLREKKYDIGKVVAQGGMGAILDAKDAATERRVAMKVMLDGSSPDDLTRFIAEAKVTAQLEHPSIVPIYELSVDENGQPFYTMKMVRGITLRKVLELLAEGIAETAGKYPLSALLTIFQKVCDAVAFAHSKGVIHRDLKPENIMLDDFGVVLVMDWGLAKIMGQAEGNAREGAANKVRVLSSETLGSTMAGTIMGTPQYMSPEQARGEVETLDARSDIYSLGAILYHILALRPSVTGKDAWAIVAKVASGDIQALTEKSVPDSLTAVVRKAMACKTAERYASVEDLQRDLAAYQAGFATSAEKAGAWKQLSLFLKRNKAATIGAAAVLVIGGIFGAKAVVEGNRATAALVRLRSTAPTFAAQSTALVENGKFDEAIEKIGIAIELDPKNADYYLFRANTLQATANLHPAIESYRRVLAMRDDAAAKTNLALCETLLAENGGSSELPMPLKSKLLDALLAQKRQADAVPLSRELKRDSDTALTLIKSRLKPVFAQPSWTWQKLVRLPDGTFQLDLRGHKVPDLAILNGLPVSILDISGFHGADLTPLRQVPLRSLTMRETKGVSLEGLRGMKLTRLDITSSDCADLSGLAGMPLESIVLNNAPNISDLAPLQGAPLKQLDAAGIRIRDLRPLSGSALERISIEATWVRSLDGIQKLPLRHLNISRTPVEDLSPIRGRPITEFYLSGCASLRDLSPISDLPALETLIVPTNLSDITFLMRIPTLKRLSNQPFEKFGWDASRMPLAADFWKTNGERLGRQVPMEKQIDKFRERLITEGNDPATVPRWTFDPEGALDIYLPRTLKVSDISELQGVSVTYFSTTSGSLRDLSPLAGAPLRTLVLAFPTGVSDLSPLKGAPLNYIHLEHCSVRDLAVLRGMPLRHVRIEQTPNLDLTPLAEIATLEEVLVPPDAKNITLLRGHKKIALLSYRFDGRANRPAQTVAEFWTEYDAKHKATPTPAK